MYSPSRIWHRGRVCRFLGNISRSWRYNVKISSPGDFPGGRRALRLRMVARASTLSPMSAPCQPARGYRTSLPRNESLVSVYSAPAPCYRCAKPWLFILPTLLLFYSWCCLFTSFTLAVPSSRAARRSTDGVCPCLFSLHYKTAPVCARHPAPFYSLFAFALDGHPHPR